MHIRCPHCCNPIELADDQGLHDVTCPSCGSSFDLLSEETITYQSGEQRTLGHFALIERIGVGAFGEVWKAKDSNLDRIVAKAKPIKLWLIMTGSSPWETQFRGLTTSEGISTWHSGTPRRP